MSHYGRLHLENGKIFLPLVARACDSQQNTLIPRRLDIPVFLSLRVVKDPSPRQPQWQRQLPAHFLIVEPESDKVALGVRILFKGFSPMQNSHVVHEANITLLHSRSHLVLSSNEVYCIQRFSLGLVQTWYAIGPRIFRRVADQQTTRKINDDLVILAVHDGTLVVGWVSTEPSAVSVSIFKQSLRQDVLRVERPVWLG